MTASSFTLAEFTLMDAITAITQRVSVAQLTGPGPSQEQLEQLYQAAFRAPDHGRMRPWRYLTVCGEGLVSLGEVFAKAGLQKDPSLGEDKLEKMRRMPQRAPLMIIAIGDIQSGVKVPEVEQRLAVGAGVQNILTAAYSMGLGAIWRTGDMAYNPYVMESLGLKPSEELIGFIYLGHVNCTLKKLPEMVSADYVQSWPIE